MTGTIKIQLKPSKLIEARFDVATTASARTQLEEILTSNAVYFSDPAYAKAVGKPWVKARIAELSSQVGVGLGSLLQNLEGSNPLDQAALFTASTNVRVVGSATIDGIATTEYAGSYSPSAALAELSPQRRTLLGPMLRSIGTNPVDFRIWIDGQHLIRKAENTDNVRGQTVTTSFDVIAINQPVKVTLPAPDKIAPLPRV